MMIYPKCKEEIPLTLFCINCGAPLTNEARRIVREKKKKKEELM